MRYGITTWHSELGSIYYVTCSLDGDNTHWEVIKSFKHHDEALEYKSLLEQKKLVTKGEEFLSKLNEVADI